MESIQIKLKPFYTVDRKKAKIIGDLVFNSPEALQHEGVQVKVEGRTSFEVSPQNKSFLSYLNNIKPVLLANKTIQVLPAGTIPQGKVEIPFLVLVEPEQGLQLYDTYHGEYITIKYTLQCTISSTRYSQGTRNITKEVFMRTKFIKTRQLPSPQSSKGVDFVIEAIVRSDNFKAPEISFEILKAMPHSEAFAKRMKELREKPQPSNILNGSSSGEKSSKGQVREKSSIHKVFDLFDELYVIPFRASCRINGLLHSTVFAINKPLTGEITIVRREVTVEVKQVEVQLLAIETCAPGYKPDVSVIEATTIVKGNIATEISIPIHMVFPKLLTCPTIITDTFKIEYAVKIELLIKENVENRYYYFSEEIPIKIAGFTS